MLKILFLLFVLWPSYYFWQHPEDTHNPGKIIDASKELLESVVDVLPFLPEPEKTQPPGILVATYPSMSAVTASTWQIGSSMFTPLYNYHARARVLSKTHYTIGREADIAPYDLVLGWRDMSDSRVLSQIIVTQSHRMGNYRYPDSPPIPLEMIPLETGNMHIIPANDDILHTLHQVIKGDVIELEGYLVVVIQSPDNWKWRSDTSTTSEGKDTGKIIWVTKLNIE